MFFKYFRTIIKSLEQENSTLKMEVSFLKESLEVERQERIKLQDAILLRTGFISNTQPNTDPQNFQPIGNPRSWGSVRQRLERESLDRALAKQPPKDNGVKKEELAKTLKEVDDFIAKEEAK